MLDPASTDAELLDAWLGRRHEPAFHALVSRYAGLVHSAARRRCGNDALAAEASQLTFILLARKAPSLVGRASLAGWLHLTAVRQTKDLLRQSRREQHKRERLAMETSNESATDAWRDVRPVIDEALASLPEKDREALLLRFYRSMSVREVATALGIATDAAQKRIDRATERLRGKLVRLGCQTGGLPAGLLTGLSADAQAAVPAVSALASKAIAAGAGTSSGLAGFLALTLAAMKSTSLILPLVALVVAGFWTGSKFQTLSAMEADNAALRGKIDSAQAASRPKTVKRSEPDPNAPIDWRRLATEEDNGPEVARFQRRLPSRSWQEMLATFDQVMVLECSAARRVVLEYAMAGAMGKLNPEWVLERFSDRLRDSRNDQKLPLREVFAGWLDRDLAKAAAWLDKQTAAGAFRAKSLRDPDQPRVPFEAALIFRLLTTDPDAASRRWAELPEDMLQGVMSELHTENHQSLPAEQRKDPEIANFVRQTFPPDEQARWIFDNGPDGHNSDYYPLAVAYLDRIAANPAERTNYLERFAGAYINRISQNRKVSDDDIRVVQGWFEKVSPDDVDRMTGRAISQAMLNRVTSMRFAQASEIAVSALDSTGKDEILATLLETVTLDKSEVPPALKLSARIKDEPRRAAIIRRLEALEFR